MNPETAIPTGDSIDSPAAQPRARRIDLSRFALGLKLALMFVLTLCFLIPLGMLGGLTDERRGRIDEATNEASQSWGGPLEVRTPVLVVPVVYAYLDDKNKEAFGERDVMVYPKDLGIEGNLTPELRKRGIFTIPLFSYSGTIRGSFELPALADLGADAVKARWDRASFALPLSDYQGLAEQPTLDWNGLRLQLDAPKPDMGYGGTALAARLGAEGWKRASFELHFAARGSGSLRFLPAARSASVDVSSVWASPSFFGSALPDSRSVGPEGMKAIWKTVRLGLGTATVEKPELRENLPAEGGFGFTLFDSRGIYQMTDRSLKYGILFIIIPFAALFLFESLKRIRIHALQYILIGLANCVFFLVLLALSEHIPFMASYAAAAAVVVALCAAYSASILPRKRDGWVMGAILATLYGYMFTALQSEDYALLIGAIGLLILLGATMMATRKVDWYRLGQGGAEKT